MMMTLHTSNKCDDEIQELPQTKKFLKLLDQLECYAETEQKQKIEEMNGLIDEMNQKEFELTFTEVLFNKIYELIKEKKLHCENAILLLKRIGCCLTLKNVWNRCFEKSMLSKRFEKMIIEEDQKKEGKNEKLLAGLCECYLLCKHFSFEEELLSICIPHVLKIASNKEEGIEVQKEVEMALFALRSISSLTRIEKDQFVNEIKEIIEHHQKHQNLTRLAYRSAWQFFINRLIFNDSLEEMIVNELHFVREVTRELEDLSKCVDWKRKKGEKGEKEVNALVEWLRTLNAYSFACKLWNEKFSTMICSLDKICRAAREKDRKIFEECICIFVQLAKNEMTSADCLQKGDSFDLIFLEIQESTLEDRMTRSCLGIFLKISERLKENADKRCSKAEWKKMKRRIFEMMEKEGFEDIITCLRETFATFNKVYFPVLPLNIDDFFVNA